MPQAEMIAIDGPAASGKSTLACRLAETLDYLYFDTGVMYRAVTWFALDHDRSIDDEDKISALAERLDIDVEPASGEHPPYRVLVDGEDITGDLRSPEIDADVSQVSAYPRVRLAMSARQREIGRRGEVVMVGRDIGTVVLPEADLKIYLDASVEARAQRRYQEIKARGEPAELEAILRAMKARDAFDSSRQFAPLRPAEDAIILDSTSLSIEETYERALELARGENSRQNVP